MQQAAGSTMIQPMGIFAENTLFIKRDDLIPVSFGGNKARKAVLFFREIDAGDYDCVVTYGSGSSNHCRVVSNLAAMRKMPCYIIEPQEASKPTFNRKMMELFGAQWITVPVCDVHDTIENKLRQLQAQGKKPYFIPGGGHGNLGTQAYVNCYEEIRAFEKEWQTYFDYIFLASGTGTTQAGLICGQLMYGDARKIVGISIARKNPRGGQVVVDSVQSYLDAMRIGMTEEEIRRATVFDDSYTEGGYGKESDKIQQEIKQMLLQHGIPLDTTYTGKAYWGMRDYIQRWGIKGKNILFIHTGGTPLFFDDLLWEKRE